MSSTGAKVGVVAAVVGALAAVLALFWPRNAAADPAPPKPKPEPETDPTPGPKPEIAPDPLKPSSSPTKGHYYGVLKGDSMLGILKRAGFTSLVSAYRVMIAHRLNAWIGTETDSAAGAPYDRRLRLYQRFRTMENASVVGNPPWAWNTAWMSTSSGRWPVVYVPRDDEVST